jgi:hypothetical protein
LIIDTWDNKGMETKEHEVSWETMKCGIYDIDRDEGKIQKYRSVCSGVSKRDVSLLVRRMLHGKTCLSIGNESVKGL